MSVVNLQKKYPGLVWSNPKASREIYIRQALLRPRFTRLFSMASDFGVSKLKKEWTVLKIDGGFEVEKAAPEVERILKNMDTGIAIAKMR